MASYNESGCNDQSGASCFKECSIGQDCPSGSGCDPGCGLCGCSSCPACSASTHIGSWHLANIFRLFINFYKLLMKTEKSISNYNIGLNVISMFARQTEFFTLTRDKKWTNRQDWINNNYFSGLFFDDIGWWILANIDLYELLDDHPQFTTISKKSVLKTAIKLTNIISNANSSLCGDKNGGNYKSIEWNCPDWAFNSAQKNIITNCLVIMAQARLIPFIDNKIKEEYLESIEKIWNFLTTYSITNPTLQYGTQSEQYTGTVYLIDIQSNGTIIVNDHLGNLNSDTTKYNYSTCTPCEQRMNSSPGCTNIPCTFMNCNQWTYNYGAVIGTLLALNKIKNQLNLKNMGKHTNFLTLAKQTTTSLLAPRNVAVTTYSLPVDAKDASFVSNSILKDNCTLWAGTICNPDQWIFRGLTIWWLGELIKVCPDCSTFKSFISKNSQKILQNSTKFKNITIYPFKWDDPTFDWCELNKCIPTCSQITCADFYKNNGHNRFEISNQIGAGYVLNTEFLLNS